MTELCITPSQARRFLLRYLGLLPPRSLHGKQGTLDFVRHIGCIQFDPLNIIGRNPDLVLQARVADYRPEMLEALLYQDRALLDGWDKMMAIYPVEDWPFWTRRRAEARQHRQSAEEVDGALDAIRHEIETRGPLSSLDLDHDGAVSWAWGPTRLARAALESMYHWGELIVHHKVNTRKVYDFAWRHLPAELLAAPDPFADEHSYLDACLLRRLGNVGLLWERTGSAWLGMPGAKAATRARTLQRLTENGQVLAVTVKGLDRPFWLRRSELPLLEQVVAENTAHAESSDQAQPASATSERLSRAALIAPLDNLMWHREMVEALFGFYYRWEVYTPVAKREYGYYVLPVLYGERLVARCEPVRDQEHGALLIKNWWWQEGVDYDGAGSNGASSDAALRQAIEEMLQRFCAFQGLEGVLYSDEAAAALGK